MIETVSDKKLRGEECGNLLNCIIYLSQSVWLQLTSLYKSEKQHMIEFQAKLLCCVPALFCSDVEHLPLRGKKRVA